MAGKQIGFYASEVDERFILNSLSELADASICLPLSTSPFAFFHSGNGFAGLPSSFSAHQVVISRNVDHGAIKYKYLGDDRFYVDKVNSNVVEYTRSYRASNNGALSSRGTCITKARLWYATKQEDGNRKSDSFVEWALKFASIIKRDFAHSEDGVYVGPDVGKLRKSGQRTLI